MALKIYADGADIASMKYSLENDKVEGFTTNPSLMKKAGITDYKEFSREVVNTFPEHSISFEVFGDDLETMSKEALALKDIGENVFVKIPVINTKGESSASLIKELSNQGVNLNVTAVFTVEQVKEVVEALNENSKSIVSVFAGRIADTGIDPMPIMKEAAEICHSKKNIDLLWASTREVYNIEQAKVVGCDIITVPNDILKKYNKNKGKDLLEMSKETVQGFNKDVNSLGFSIL